MSADNQKQTERAVMANTTHTPTRFIGCDVGKTDVVVFDDASGQTRTIPNRPAELAAFAAELDDTCLVVCEATGGWEAELLSAMVSARRAVHRACARKVKAFIRSFGTLGKTDAIDARALARYGRERHLGLARWQAHDPVRDQLQALVLLRRDFVNQRVATKNRMSGPNADVAKVHLQSLLDCIDGCIKAIEADIEALLDTRPELRHAIDTVSKMVGIGAITAAGLVALMPELGTLDRRQAASLAGLAPHPRQSGASDGYRRVKGGRPEIRKVLFMAALTASRRCPKLKAFYQRLIANGKKPIVAVTAVMRKMIVICNAMLRDKTALEIGG
jgi:transposase